MEKIELVFQLLQVASAMILVLAVLLMMAIAFFVKATLTLMAKSKDIDYHTGVIRETKQDIMQRVIVRQPPNVAETE